MTIGPENEREALIHQASYLQGFEDGVKAITVKLREQHLKGLAAISKSVESFEVSGNKVA